MFPSFKEELEFLETYNLDFARATLLETHGRYLEAAELHLSENRPLDAIRDFLNVKGSRDAIQKAAKILLEGLWHRCSFAVPPKDVAANRDVAELLDLAREFPDDLLDPLDRHEVRLLRDAYEETSYLYFFSDCHVPSHLTGGLSQPRKAGLCVYQGQ